MLRAVLDGRILTNAQSGSGDTGTNGCKPSELRLVDREVGGRRTGQSLLVQELQVLIVAKGLGRDRSVWATSIHIQEGRSDIDQLAGLTL